MVCGEWAGVCLLPFLLEVGVQYGLTLERDKAMNSQCNWRPLEGVIRPTDEFSGTDGSTVYIQIVIFPSEFVKDVDLSGFGTDLTLVGSGRVGQVHEQDAWETVDVGSIPLVIVFSVRANGSDVDDILTIDITDYTSFIDDDGNVIIDNTDDAINVVA